MSKINRYTRAMRQMRSPLKESVPTNSMQGIYVDTPFTVTTPPEEVIQGQGADYEQDDSGGDTSGLFDSNGDQLTAVPPVTTASPDNSYILGPMASMWYSWGNFSTIGYIREADRKMVNLASITGPLHTWDKTSGFNSYGQLTLEQAVWFVDNPKYGGVDNNYANANYRAYYPGPPSSSTDSEGRYLCTITGVPKQLPSKYQPPDDFTPGSNVSGDDEKSPLRNIVPGSAKPKGWLDKVKDAVGDAWDDAKDFAGDLWDQAKELGDWEHLNRAGKTAARIFRSLTDDIRYGGDDLVKGLGQGVEYDKFFKGGGKKISDMIFGGAENAERILGSNWHNTDYWTSGKTAGSNWFKGGELDVARMYKDLGKTRGTPWGAKAGDYWIAKGAGNVKGKRTLKNPWGSRVSRGNMGAPEIAVKSGTLDATRATADDLAKMAAKTTRTSKVLSRAVPFVNWGMVAVDVAQRTSKGDYAGAALGFLSGIPGPPGWLALGAQVAYDANILDVAADKASTFLYNKVTGSNLKSTEKIGFKQKAKDFKKESYLMEEQEDKTAKNLKAIYDHEGQDDYVRELATSMILIGMDPAVIAVVVKAAYGKTDFSEDEQRMITEVMPKMIKEMEKKKPKKESFYTPEKRKLLKEIKQSYVMPEEKKVKLTGYRPKLPNKDKMRQLADSMNVPEKVTFAKAETGTWKAGELERGRKSSQGKKNEVLELLGQGEDSWVYMTETSRKKSGKAMYENFTLMNEQGVGTYKISRKEPLRSDYVLFLEYEDGTKSTMLQSELNEKMSDQSEKWRKDWKEPIKYEDQPAYKKVKKILSKEIPLKDIQPEFPEKAPPKLDPETQMHPDMFKRHDYFTKLDPDSAKTMAAAPTGDPQIDSEVEKAKKKPK